MFSLWFCCFYRGFVVITSVLFRLIKGFLIYDDNKLIEAIKTYWHHDSLTSHNSSLSVVRWFINGDFFYFFCQIESNCPLNLVWKMNKSSIFKSIHCIKSIDFINLFFIIFFQGSHNFKVELIFFRLQYTTVFNTIYSLIHWVTECSFESLLSQPLFSETVNHWITLNQRTTFLQQIIFWKAFLKSRLNPQ